MPSFEYRMVLSRRWSLAHPIMSLFSAATMRVPSACARRTNSRLPSSPDSSPVNDAKTMVAGIGRFAITRAASSSAAVAELSSSAPGPDAFES